MCSGVSLFLFFVLFFLFGLLFFAMQLAENAAFVAGSCNVTHDALPKATGDMVGTAGSWAVPLAPGDTAVPQPLVQQHGHGLTKSSQLREGSKAVAGNTLWHFILYLKLFLSPGSSFSACSIALPPSPGTKLAAGRVVAPALSCHGPRGHGTWIFLSRSLQQRQTMGEAQEGSAGDRRCVPDIYPLVGLGG